METNILPVDPTHIQLGNVKDHSTERDWILSIKPASAAQSNLTQAAQELRTSDVPVAFPTETVYGLGADATRSNAVQGIFKAKNRPSDNPLIVHVHSIRQLRNLVRGKGAATDEDGSTEGIPSVYLPLIKKFWPGPLSLIMPLGQDTALAPEVTAGLTTFGARMPSNPVALALLKMADVPVAAPSANASGKPSPTTAQHVRNDMDGRISTIVDGGACDVGVESTVVDGLCDPPLILRPGGISLDELRACPGWENVGVGYKNVSEKDSKPRAPGMKYKHYSPKATVVLFEAGSDMPTAAEFLQYAKDGQSIGIVRTATWPEACGLKVLRAADDSITIAPDANSNSSSTGAYVARRAEVEVGDKSARFSLWELSLGAKPQSVAHGLFAALREFDLRDVGTIFVEGIDESSGDVAAAVMNRLRKAAEVHI